MCAVVIFAAVVLIIVADSLTHAYVTLGFPVSPLIPVNIRAKSKHARINEGRNHKPSEILNSTKAQVGRKTHMQHEAAAAALEFKELISP